MRSTRRGSPCRPAARIVRSAASAALSLTLLLCAPGLALADPGAGPDNPEILAALIADVADVNQSLQDLSAAIETEQESVNKSFVDVETARDNAAAAQQNVEAGQQAVKDASAAIAAAQQRFDTFAAATYVHGPSDSYLTAADPQDIIATASAGQTLAASSQQVMDNLQRARTEQVNKESAARQAKQQADQAVAGAQSSQDAAVRALTDAQHKFSEQQDQINRLAAERNAAQAKLAAARSWSVPAPGQGATAPAAAPAGDRWDPGAPGGSEAPKPAVAPFGNISEWDTTLPMVPSAFASGDPMTILNSVLGVSESSARATANMGRGFLEKLGILKPSDSGITNGQIPRVYGRQAAEYVIRRGMSQRGVPYSWGGGSATGPSRGIDSGSGTVGYDCSGLILYSFAGVGIKLPHYSGAQYKLGRRIPAARMRRGDVIFYGPGGSQHVTLYLGNGQMLEAPNTGSVVKVSPVRTSGMTPYVIRYVEY